MPIINVLRIIAILLGGFALQGCAITPEQMSRQNQDAHRVRVEALGLQGRETERRTDIAATQRRAAEQAGQRCTTVAVIDDNPVVGVNRQARTVCADPGVTVSNDQRLPPAARPIPPQSPNVLYGGGHRIPYSHYDTGFRPPGHYWGGGSHRPLIQGGICYDWFGRVIAYEPCRFR